jgi:hypothetical protein
MGRSPLLVTTLTLLLISLELLLLLFDITDEGRGIGTQVSKAVINSRE